MTQIDQNDLPRILLKERRLSDRLHKRETREQETDDEARSRRDSNRLHMLQVREHEAEDEKKHRKEADRSQKASVRAKEKSKVPSIEETIAKFKKQIKQQPVYICTSCHRLLFRKGVQLYKRSNYDMVDKEVVDQVLAPKFMINSKDTKQYICITCHRNLKQGKVPVQAKGNFMDLDPQPEVLKGFTPCGLRLICRRIPFIRLISLPRGKQKGIKGAAVNVPADLGPVCTLLPRLPTEAHIVPLNLKRKLEYKHAYLKDLIKPTKIMEALRYLKKNNPLYHDIEINDDWLDEWQETDPQLTNALIEGVHVDTNNEEIEQASENTQLPTNNLPPELNQIADEFGFTMEDVTDNNDSLFLAILKQMALNGYLHRVATSLKKSLKSLNLMPILEILERSLNIILNFGISLKGP